MGSDRRARPVGGGERGRSRAALAVVAAMAAAYGVYFTLFTWYRHGLFLTHAYDFGTFDQGIYLVASGQEPFVTVRGLHLLGDHVRLFSYVLAPLYRIWDDARALLAAQTAAIAAGALVVARFALREAAASRFAPAIAVALAASYLLHPAVQNLNLDHAHPDAFASTFLLAAAYYLRGRRWVLGAIAVALAMSCKEDVALAGIGLGATLALGGERRAGLALATASALYFALCLGVVLPHFNGVGFFRGEASYFEQVKEHALDPVWLAERLTGEQTRRYFAALLLPLAGTPLLAPAALFAALPALAVNLASDVGYMRTVDYHYATSIVPFLYVAAAIALARLVRRRPDARVAAVLVSLVVGGAVAANAAWSRVPPSRLGHLWTMREAVATYDSVAAIRAALAEIPADAAVSADYSLVPQLSHRARIYMFPNPFRSHYWGIRGESPDDPRTVDFIVVRPNVVSDSDREMLSEMVEGGAWSVRRSNDLVVVYERASGVR